MSYHWSLSRLAFYPTALRTDYEAAGSWPSDAVAVEDETFATFSGAPPHGKQRGFNADGLPAWVDLPPPTMDERLAQLAAYRYEREIQGVQFKGSLFPTDRDSRSTLIGAVVVVSLGQWVDGSPWKAADGTFVPMTANDVQTLGLLQAGYVRACYIREAELAAEIRAGGTPDITAGWPAQ